MRSLRGDVIESVCVCVCVCVCVYTHIYIYADAVQLDAKENHFPLLELS